MSTWRQVLYARVQVQILTPQEQVRVQVLQKLYSSTTTSTKYYISGSNHRKISHSTSYKKADLSTHLLHLRLGQHHVDLAENDRLKQLHMEMVD